MRTATVWVAIAAVIGAAAGCGGASHDDVARAPGSGDAGAAPSEADASRAGWHPEPTMTDASTPTEPPQSGDGGKLGFDASSSACRRVRCGEAGSACGSPWADEVASFCAHTSTASALQRCGPYFAVAYTSSGAWVVPGWSVSPPPFSASYYDSNGALVGFTSSNDGCEAYDDAFRWPTCSPTPFDAHCGAGKGGDAATDASDGSAAPSDASSLD